MKQKENITEIHAFFTKAEEGKSNPMFVPSIIQSPSSLFDPVQPSCHIYTKTVLSVCKMPSMFVLYSVVSLNVV